MNINRLLMNTNNSCCSSDASQTELFDTALNLQEYEFSLTRILSHSENLCSRIFHAV